MAADIVRLSKNFALSELTKSATAERLGVDNTPNLYHLVNLTHLAIHILQPVRDKFGVITINSGPTFTKHLLPIGLAILNTPIKDHLVASLGSVP